MRRTYRYDKDLKEMVEVTNEKKPRKGLSIIRDIKPYRVVGPEYGKVIGSRSTHREYLKRHNLIEIGNERKYFGLPD